MAANDKCMYCESKVAHVDYADVEHIKPKAADKFPHLEFDWNNLGYACARCNIAKGDKYDPATPFVDPYAEDPADHLYACGAFVFARNGSERGEVTMRELALNRSALLERREERIKEINKALLALHRTQSPALRTAAREELQKEAEPDKEYSFIVAAQLNAHG